MSHAPRGRTRSDDERSRVVAAALALAQREGAGFTVMQLAQAAKMSRATLYRRLGEDPALSQTLATLRRERATVTRAELLRATLALLRTQSVTSLTMESVASRAGVSLATVYRHFANREALLTEAVRELGPPPSLRDTLSTEGPLEAVLEHAGALILARLTTSAAPLWLALMAEPEQALALRKFRRREESLSNALLEYLRRPEVRGRLDARPAEQHMAAFMGLLLGAFVLRRIPSASDAPTLTPADVVSLFLDGTRRRDAAPAPKYPRNARRARGSR